MQHYLAPARKFLDFRPRKPTILANFKPILTAGRPEELGNMYLCIISRKRGNFLDFRPRKPTILATFKPILTFGRPEELGNEEEGNEEKLQA